MNPQIKIAVIGGTGKAGKYLIKQLPLQNFPVKFLHRKPDTLEIHSQLIEIVKGDARDPDAIYSLLKGCDVVLSCLSQPTGQPTGEPTIFSDATRNILTAMRSHRITRYITTAGLNVDTPTDDKGPQARFGTKWMYENFPQTTADRQVEYQLLADSNVNWTMVRLPLIDQTDEFVKTTTSLTDCPGSNISATSLALFMIAQIGSAEFVKQAPFIANKQIS